jgi:hypothetical protein
MTTVNCRVPSRDDLIAYCIITLIGVLFIFTINIEVNAQEPADPNQPEGGEGGETEPPPATTEGGGG